MKVFSFLVLISLLIFSCSSSSKVVKEEPGSAEPKYDESFDPNSLNDDDIRVGKTETPDSRNVPDNILPESENEFNLREMMGYRIQIIATRSIEAATQVENEAGELFSTMDHKTYLTFEEPLYKVRVGDVVNRSDAEKILETARDYGYREAFIVRSKVNVAVSSPQ